MYQDENQFDYFPLTSAIAAPDDNPFCKNVVLRRPEEFKPGERPQVSLHLLVKNGESCVGRLLANVGPYIDEIVAVVNDTTDLTIQILREYAAARGPEFNLDIVEVTHESHPELYIMDVPETYLVGRPLASEMYVGPFTGSPVLADWAEIVVIAPATANIIGKLVHGIADDLLSTVLLAVDVPIVVAPAMNRRMWENRVVQENVRRVRELGHHVIEPGEGYLACGTVGVGRLAEVKDIIDFIGKLLK